MNVKELKELLAEAPDDMLVYIPSKDEALGCFMFQEACICETGVTEFGPAPELYGHEDQKTQPTSGFIIAPHGFGEEPSEEEIQKVYN